MSTRMTRSISRKGVTNLARDRLFTPPDRHPPAVAAEGTNRRDPTAHQVPLDAVCNDCGACHRTGRSGESQAAPVGCIQPGGLGKVFNILKQIRQCCMVILAFVMGAAAMYVLLMSLNEESEAMYKRVQQLEDACKSAATSVGGGRGETYSGLEKKLEENCNAINNIEAGYVSKKELRDVINQALFLYDADRTGKPDFALESSGGKIVSIRNTATAHDIGELSYKLLGLAVCCNTSPGPETIIRASSMPGECWPFLGSTGSVVIRLLGPVFVSGFTLEHIPRTLAPSGNISSAPREVSVVGLDRVDDTQGHVLAKFVYDAAGPPLQYFPADDVGRNRSYRLVEMIVRSNHGHPHYTCVYRLRVHGLLNQGA